MVSSSGAALVNPIFKRFNATKQSTKVYC
jgi:hypothetical protein